MDFVRDYMRALLAKEIDVAAEAAAGGKTFSYIRL